jgi:hypothetical protein
MLNVIIIFHSPKRIAKKALKVTTGQGQLRLYSKDLAPTFESDASSFFTTVYSVLYGKTDADFQRIIDQESTPKTENRPLDSPDQEINPST